MASLVADYSSDENTYSDSDSIISRNKSSAHDRLHTETETNNFLFSSVNNENDSDSDSDPDSEDSEDSEEKEEKSETEKLPNPLAGDVPTSSVFVNPFMQAELAKQYVLEKHVQMTEKRNPANKKICFKFKKGRCNKGKSCRFLHDIDTIRSAVYNTETSDNFGQHTPNASVQHFIQEPVDDDNYLSNSKRKKKVGMTDNLIPPKKALISLQEERNRERPWTVKRKT